MKKEYLLKTIKEGKDKEILEFTLLLNKFTEKQNSNITISISVDDDFKSSDALTYDGINNVEEPKEALPIVLMDDISFNNVGGGFTKLKM